jgi:hypothetical protein
MACIGIIGCGPTGLSACHELLESGYEANQIYLIDSNISTNNATFQSSNERPLSVYESFKSSSKSGAFKKPNSRDLKDVSSDITDQIPPSNAHVWGASCLPFPNWGKYSIMNSPQFLEKYASTIRRWGVHAELDRLEKHFALTSEIVNDLKRKKISEEFSNACLENDVTGGHSRLAIMNTEKSPCQFCGKCLQGCPSSVPWSPTKELERLLAEFPNLNQIDRTVASVRTEENSTQVLFEDGEILDLDQVFVAAGWRQTPQLMTGSPTNRNFTKELNQSTVVMRAFVLDEPTSESDFYNSFSYNDAVLSMPPGTQGENGYLAQIYFPTAELAGRVTSIAPKLLHQSISMMLRREYKWSSNLYRRIGIVMVFVEGGKWSLMKNEILQIESVTLPKISAALKLIGGHLLPGARQVLDAGGSEHVGSWEQFRGHANQLLSTDEKYRLKIPKVFPIDTTLLPIVPPGPHTAISAALSRLAISHWLSQ